MATNPQESIPLANAAASAALMAEWARCGVRHIVVAPGSRSTPLALAAATVASDGRVSVHVHLDERSAAFVALGIGLNTGTPAVLVCTSGTAAANFAPAVIEAGLSAVPLIVATADRPPELRGRGAPQTIDQVELYGGAVRWFVDVAPPDDGDPVVDASEWSSLARTAWQRSRTGPVHLNLTFREPLVDASSLAWGVGSPPDATESEGGNSEIDKVDPETVRRLDVAALRPPAEPLPPTALAAQRGVFVVGGRSLVDPASLTTVIDRLDWPIIADPLSGLRTHSNAVTAADSILRDDLFAKNHTPDLVVRIGRPPASKVVNRWVATAGCPLVQVGGPGRIDPDRNVSGYCDLDAFSELLQRRAAGWTESWTRANQAAEEAIAAQLVASDALSDPAVARVVADSLIPGEQLVVSSSMPIRDLEWFGGPQARALSNRGANGIDGVMSTGLGVALTGVPTKVLIGDLAAIHDANALVGGGTRDVPMTVVINDNDGGGIFSFLPQADLLDEQLFEVLFGTPTATDLGALARAFGVEFVDVSTASQLGELLAQQSDRTRILRVATDRVDNVEIHRQLNEVVAEAVRHLE